VHADKLRGWLLRHSPFLPENQLFPPVRLNMGALSGD
jgi:hypothetical protein